MIIYDNKKDTKVLFDGTCFEIFGLGHTQTTTWMGLEAVLRQVGIDDLEDQWPRWLHFGGGPAPSVQPAGGWNIRNGLLCRMFTAHAGLLRFAVWYKDYRFTYGIEGSANYQKWGHGTLVPLWSLGHFEDNIRNSLWTKLRL